MAAADPLEDIDFAEIDEDLKQFQQEDSVRDALSRGVNLREYARQIEQDLRAVERESIQDYIHESDNLASLHSQIQSCDAVLEHMESLLGGFQSNLGTISDEIKQLQEESYSMNISLNNRKAVEEKLGSFVDSIVLPPRLITGICEGEVNEAYLLYLTELNKKMTFVSGNKARACQDVEPELERLRIRATGKIRDFLLQRIGALKKPNTNIQILQQNVLIKFKYLNQFLVDHSPSVAQEVRNIYVETMSKITVSNLRRYVSSVIKLQIDVATRNDLLGTDDGQLKSYFTSKLQLRDKGSVFTLGDRELVVEDVEKPSIIIHVAQQNKDKFPFEQLMRSMNQLLLDSVTSEFLFTLDFFGRMDLFDDIFGKTVAFYLETLKDYLFGCFDAVGVLLMIMVNHRHQVLMTRRRVPWLDAYFDQVNMLLWPRFKVIFDLNVESVRNAQTKALFQAKSDIHPHYVTRRYAEFSASILALNASEKSEMVNAALVQLQREIERFVQRMAAEYPDQKQRIVFVINNYDLILSVYSEHNIQWDEVSALQKLLEVQTQAFVEEELLGAYRDIIFFVKEMTPIAAAAASGTGTPLDQHVKPGSVEKLVKDFAGCWKQGIEAINANVMNYFPNFKTGMEILKQVLTQLLLYYQRFLDIVQKSNLASGPVSKDIVSIPSILYEVKKYSRSF